MNAISTLLVSAAITTGAAAQGNTVAAAPPVALEKLRLVDVPKASGPKRELFNGRDLGEWRGWLGYADPAITYRAPPGTAPIGTSRDIAGDFAVRRIDGAPALWVKGETWGSLIHKADLRNYHLRLQFKWGAKTWAPRLTQPQNNGVLYHTHGQPGAVFGTWSPSVEFEIMRGSTGMVVAVGGQVRGRVPTVDDPAIIAPHLRFRLGGRVVELVNGTPTWNVEGATDTERPVGEWNTLDLYVVGDRAVHVVNGVPVMAVHDLATVDSKGVRTPLTHGHIQLQSEGAETWFRNITVEPITTLPRIVPAK